MTTKTKKTTIFVHPYRQGSKSAKALAEALGAKRILLGGRSKFKHSSSKTVINWGSSTYHVDKNTPMLNSPDAVAVASNKLTFFRALEKTRVNLVPFTEDAEVVREWLDECHRVCVRSKLTGHSGEGLAVIDPKESSEKVLDIPAAKLYTKYVPKALEYRVHVVQGKVIRVQKKILKPELSAKIKDSDDPFVKGDIDWEVRNHSNGFIYVTDGVLEDCPKMVLEQAKLTLTACKLDFGAVDIIFNNKKQKAFVLEVNTSPGLEGTTVDAYAEALRDAKPLDWSMKPAASSGNPYSQKMPTLHPLLANKAAARDCLYGGFQHFTQLMSWSDMNTHLRILRLPPIDEDNIDTPNNRLFCEAVVQYRSENNLT